MTNPPNDEIGVSAPSFDPVWEDIYKRGEQLNRYPYSNVVSFVIREQPVGLARAETRVLEIGCGAGNNLWFAAREGFQVAGVDASPSAIKFANARFAEEGLSGDIRLGDFTSLPFADDSFDLAINRAAVTQTGLTSAAKAVAEVGRVLKKGGKFYNEIYSNKTRRGGIPGPDGVTLNVEGWLAGVGQICFYSKTQLDALFAKGWKLSSVIHTENVDTTVRPHLVVGNWMITAIKT